MVKANPEEVVQAFRKAAKELGCDQSEERFQEALFDIGTHNTTHTSQQGNFQIHVLKASTEEQLDAVFANLSQSRKAG